MWGVQACPQIVNQVKSDIMKKKKKDKLIKCFCAFSEFGLKCKNKFMTNAGKRISELVLTGPSKCFGSTPSYKVEFQLITEEP